MYRVNKVQITIGSISVERVIIVLHLSESISVGQTGNLYIRLNEIITARESHGDGN